MGGTNCLEAFSNSVVCASENIADDSADDTHVWLDPVCALREAENIKIALTKIDPENAPAYDENLKDIFG